MSGSDPFNDLGEPPGEAGGSWDSPCTLRSWWQPANSILNSEKLKAFPLRSGLRQGCHSGHIYCYFINIVLEVLATQIRKRNKGIQVGKEDVKLSVFAGNMILLYIENPTDFTKNC